MPSEEMNTAAEEGGEPGGRTRENPEASRKEFDENAAAEILPGTEQLLHDRGEGNGAPAANKDSETRADQVREAAKKTADLTVAAEMAEQRGVSEDAAAADSALTYYSVLLQDRLGTLFECKRLNAYWETLQPFVTIHKTAPEHALLLQAGCYDVSVRLLPENLRVDEGWVARKNPGLIVKIMDSGALGAGSHSDRAARAATEGLRGRAGWSGIDAVKNRRILLLSEELLETPALRTAAMLLIAKTANPELFADVDPEEALQMLMEESAGTLPTGIYYYKEGGL